MQDAASEEELSRSWHERQANRESATPSELQRSWMERLATWQPPTPSEHAALVARLSAPQVPSTSLFSRPEEWLASLFAGCPPQSVAGGAPAERQDRQGGEDSSSQESQGDEDWETGSHLEARQSQLRREPAIRDQDEPFNFATVSFRSGRVSVDSPCEADGPLCTVCGC
jgi:hypothetical protein